MPRQYQQGQGLDNKKLEGSQDNDSDLLAVTHDDSSAMDIDVSMEVDEEFESEVEDLCESEEESEEQEKERETLLSTYLGPKNRQFVPYEFNEETNTVDIVIDSREQDSEEEPVKWYSSSRIKGLKQLNQDHKQDMEQIASFYDKRFWIESAVAGGRCYRLLLGKMQPKMHACIGEAKSEFAGGARSYRLSKEIIDFYTWESVDHNDARFLADKPVIGLTATFLINYFLANPDVNSGNHGIVDLGDYWQSIAIDPECCFSHFFYTDRTDDIKRFICELPQYVPNQLFNKKELFETLEKIISTPLSSYKAIFDASFSKCYAKQKNLYLSNMAGRIQLFKEAAYSIKGFREYLQEREREQTRRYKALEDNFASSREQQSENQQFLEEFCEYRPQPQSFWGNNRFGFYNKTAKEEQVNGQAALVNGCW